MTEWWFWEASAFSAGELGTASLAAHTVAYAIIPLCFMFPLGICIGLSTRIGTLLGEGRVALSILLTKYTFCLGLTITILSGILVFSTKTLLIALFTEDPKVIEMCDGYWWMLSFYVFLDGSWGIQRGAVIGTGQQFWMGVTMVVSLWCIGFPLMRYLSFGLGWGLTGIWVSMMTSYVILNLLLSLTYLLKDWTKLSNHIRAKQTRGLKLHQSDVIEMEDM